MHEPLRRESLDDSAPMRSREGRARSSKVVLLAAWLAAAPASPAAAQPALCGDLDGSGQVAATDALLLLKHAVGQSVTVECPPCPSAASNARALAESTICGDLDGSGSIAATDSLLLLKHAVGQSVTVSCPVCSSTTTLPITTTTLAGSASCGNGELEIESEECDRFESNCTDGARCTAECTCEAAPFTPPTSQELIEQALADGEIDYPTALLYRVWALFQAPELPEDYDGAGTSGEDATLFLELSNVRGFLPTDVEEAIAPYLVRPDDPTSIYSQDPAPAILRAGSNLDAPPPVGCAFTLEGQPDWRAHETEHFVVWSCGGGVGGTDSLAGARVATGTVAEEVWDEMTPKLGAPKPDVHSVGPAPENRIDVYILVPNQCRVRGQPPCTTIPGDALAAAAPAAPCESANGAPLTSSAYLLVGAEQVPGAAPASDDTSLFRYIMAHELFHAISFNLNLQAQGGVCTPRGPDLVADEARSWLSEASAEWASFAFFPNDGQERREILFEKFQRERVQATQGLHDTVPRVLPYEAFLYPAFIQEENDQDPQTFLDFWNGLSAVFTRDDLDAALNQAFSFAEHFRDFGVRNLNLELQGDPIFPPHVSYDPALTLGYPPTLPEPAFRISAPLDELPWDVAVAPLFATYDHFFVRDEARYVSFDLTTLPNVEHLHLDAIVKVGDQWQRRKVDGPVFTFCREKSEDDIEELYLVFSNFDYDRAGAISGTMRIESRAACPGGWSGSIRLVSTVDKHEEIIQPFHTEVEDRHVREEHRWAMAETTIVRPDGFFQDVEQVRTSWHGTRSHYAIIQAFSPNCTSTQTETGEGGGSATSYFWIQPLGDGTFTLQPRPTTEPNSFQLPIEFASHDCNGSFSSGDETTVYEGSGYVVGTPGLAMLVPDEGDPNQFSGRHTLVHGVDPHEIGETVVDVTIEWNLTRNPGPVGQDISP